MTNSFFIYTISNRQMLIMTGIFLNGGKHIVKTISICVGSSCHLKGSYDVIKRLQSLIKENGLEDEVEIKAEFCLGNCTKSVSVKVDESGPYSVNMENVDEFFAEIILG